MPGMVARSLAYGVAFASSSITSLDQPTQGIQQRQQWLQSQRITRSEMQTLSLGILKGQKLTTIFPKEATEPMADAVLA